MNTVLGPILFYFLVTGVFAQDLKENLGPDITHREVVHSALVQNAKNIFQDILNPETIMDQVISGGQKKISGAGKWLKTAGPEAYAFKNHMCLKEDFMAPDLKEKIEESLSAYTLIGNRRDILSYFGTPTQVTYCRHCPVWKYYDSIVTFNRMDQVITMQGSYFRNAFDRLPDTGVPDGTKVMPLMTKQQVIDMCGLPDHANTASSVWKYGSLHIIFNRKNGLVLSVMDSTRPGMI